MALRFPSIHYLASQAGRSFLRFPLTILAAITGVTIAIFLIETEDQVFNRFPFINAMLCAALGISLYFCMGVFAIRMRWRAAKTWLAMGAASVFLLLIYFSLPDADTTLNTSLPYIRFAFYSIIVHLLVSFVPYLFTSELNGFWNYNKALFLRLLTAVLYSGALFVGLVMALFALKLLFDVKIPDELFFELFIVMGGVFNTWFFIAGVPLEFEELDRITTYPKGLKVFSQYILLPLLGLYLLILYGYGIKIILSWNWPEGIVSYLIMVVAVLGIFTMLLIYPYAVFTENRWIRKVSRGYYILLIPLLVLLFLAIGMRLADYGFTVNRYLILATGIWLGVVCLYFISGRNNIKFVPVSLAATLLIISFGPWGIFAVSESSQVARLEAALSGADLQRNGKVTNEVIWVQDSLPNFYSPQANQNEGRLNDSLHNEVYSILGYLDDYHGFEKIHPWYLQPLDSMIRIADADTSRSRWNRVSEARVYMESLGLPYHYKRRYDYGNYFNYSAGADIKLVVAGFDQLIYLDQIYYHFDYANTISSETNALAFQRTIAIDREEYQVFFDPESSGRLRLITPEDTVYFSLAERIGALRSKYPPETRNDLPPSDMQLDTLSPKRTYRLIINSISFRDKGDTTALESITAKLLIGGRR